ncbi:MAG: SurA N-terminal domain-containing protein [Kiritimatiellia bacterium]
MFIYHFNRMIRSKLLWLVIAILTVFAFVFADIFTRGGGDGESGPSVATIGGKPVTETEVGRAMLFARGLNRSADISEEDLRKQALERIALLRVAKQFGLAASHDEVFHAIRVGLFPDGQFDEMAYRTFVQRQFGWSTDIYEEFMAEWIALQKVGIVLDSASWVSPMDLQGGSDAITDSFVTRMVVLTNSIDAATIEVSTEELQDFYEADPARYDQPARVQVRYVEKDLAPLLPLVEIADSDIEDYYDAHDRDYTRWTTNGMETLPLEEVSDEIREILAKEEACYIASTNATRDFLAYVRGKSEGIFDKYIADNGYTVVHTSALFSAEEAVESLEGIDPGAMEEFIGAAFDLDAARSDSRFGVVAGGSHLYLLSAITNFDAKTPEFDEAFLDVLRDAREEACDKAFREMAGAKAAGIRAALAEGKDFAEAAEDAMVEQRTFSWYAQQYGMTGDERAIMAGIASLVPGEVSDPIETSRGMVLAYLVSREPGEASAEDIAQLRDDVRESLAAERKALLASAWADSLQETPPVIGDDPEGVDGEMDDDTEDDE